MVKRGPNLFFKYSYLLFGPGLFKPLRGLIRFNFLSQFSWTIDPFAPNDSQIELKLEGHALGLNSNETRVSDLLCSLPRNKNLSVYNQAPWC